MAVFKVSISVTQDITGETLTFHDDSNYGSNDQSYLVTSFSSRIVSVYGADGSLLGTVTFSGTSLTATYTIVSDVYLSLQSVFTLAAGGTETGTTNYMSRQFYDIQQASNVIDPQCKCGCNPLCSDTTKANAAMNAAVTFFSVGNAVDCQIQLNAANVLIMPINAC